MPEQKRTTETQDEKLRRQEIKQEAAAREAARQAAFAGSAGGPLGPPDDISIQAVAARLGDRRFQSVQRQGMAARIRRASGNQSLQRAVAQARQQGGVGDAIRAHREPAADGTTAKPGSARVLQGEGSPAPSVQRALPALGAAAKVAGEVLAGLSAAAAIGSTVYSGGSDELKYNSTTADRLSAKTQPKKRDCKAVCLRIGFDAPWPRPNLDAVFHIIWQGNDYGEIGAARVRVDLTKTSEFSYSSLVVSFTAVKNLIQPGGDKRTWQIEWDYEGNFNPLGTGEFWFQGSFAIDAFGNFVSTKHTVRDLSLIEQKKGDAAKIVQAGPRVSRPIPPVPGGAGAAPPAGAAAD